MKFVCLHHGDQLSQELWSAIPLNIIRTLRTLGHEVVLIGGLQSQAPLFSRVKTAYYKYFSKKVYVINRDPWVFRLRAKDANRRLRDAGPVDAVLITYVGDAAYLETESPVIVIHDATWAQMLDYYPGYERQRMAAETVKGGLTLDKLGLARCDRAVYSSRWAAESVSREYGVAKRKVSVAPLGASIVNEPSREHVARYLARRGQGPMKLLFLGLEWHRKGGDIAVQVAAQIEQRGIPVELHVAGVKPDGEVPPLVRLHGRLLKNVEQEAAELRELFESSDFLLLPARAEAFGIVFAEAAAFGLPVMAADTGGVKDAARGEWGFVPPQGSSPASYADWAVKLHQNRAEYERLSWLARGCFERELNWTAFCDHLVETSASCARTKMRETTGPANLTSSANDPMN